MKILSWNINGLKKNWDTVRQLMAVELPELVCIQNHRTHNYTHPYSIDLGLPRDETIPDGEKWVCNYSRMSFRSSLSNGVALFIRWAFEHNYNTINRFDANGRPVPDSDWVYAKHAAFLGKGRVWVAEFQYFTLVTILAPGGSQHPGSKRQVERTKFDGDPRRFLFDLRSVTPVIVAGDFKIAAQDSDVHRDLGIKFARFTGPPWKVPPPPEISYIPLRVD
jgi:exonuclease III